MKLRKGASIPFRALLYLLILFTIPSGMKGQERVDSLLNLLRKEQVRTDTARVDLLNELGRSLYSDHPDSARSFLLKAREISKRSGYKEGLEESLNLLGIVHYIKSEYPKALEYWKRLLRQRRKREDLLGIQGVQNNLGLLYKKIGDYKKALQAHQEAKAIADSLGERGRVGQSMNNMGILHYELGNLQKAEEHYQKALEIYREEGMREDIGGTFTNLGLIHRQNGEYQQAIQLGRKALKYDRKVGSYRKVANDLVNLGLAFKEKGDLDSAMLYYEKAERAYKKLGNKGGLVTTWTNIAGVKLERGAPKEARSLALRAYRMADSISSLQKLKGAAAYIAEASAELGDPWMAYRYQRAHDSLSDTLLSLKKSKEVARLEARYEFERKRKQLQRQKARNRKIELEKHKAEARKERTLFIAVGGGIALLSIIVLLFFGYRQKRMANRRLEGQKEELEREKEEKELLLREVNHRVKNNLQLINSLLSLQGRRIEDEELRSLHIDSQNRIRSMGLLHEKIYKAGDMGDEGLESFVRELTERLKEAYGMEGKTELVLNMKSDGLSIMHFTPIALILNELISNALKYAFPEGEVGRISISLLPDEEGNYLLKVADNGVGLSADRKDGGPSSGLGLDIVNSLAEQIEGSFTYFENEEGTSFQVRFPTRKKDSGK